MLELGITQSVVAVCVERAGRSRVMRVTLEMGKLAAAIPEAVRFCFGLCAAGTSVEGAKLEIIEVPGRAVCRECQAEVRLDEPFGRCGRCGGEDLELISGRELRLRELQVE
ncbi:MAG: hydrogenase maturation nickel metallochaperone HypA [Steroidobacteraceae bacterium]